MSGAPAVDRMDILVRQKNNRAWTLPLPCREGNNLHSLCGLDHLSTYLTFPHGTGAQICYLATRVLFSQGLDKDIYLKRKGADFFAQVKSFNWKAVMDEMQECHHSSFFSGAFIVREKNCHYFCLLTSVHSIVSSYCRRMLRLRGMGGGEAPDPVSRRQMQ